ncbi:hypothetical protein D3C71_1969990 [compost metagenome]
MIVGGERGRLDDEDILAAHVFADLDENLLIGKPPYGRFSKRQVEIVADRFGQQPVRIACENLH